MSNNDSNTFIFRKGPEIYAVRYAENSNALTLSMTIPTPKGTRAWIAAFDDGGKVETLTQQEMEYLETSCVKPLPAGQEPRKTTRWIHAIGEDGAIASSQRDVQTDGDPCVSGSESWYTGLESYAATDGDRTHVQKLIEKATAVRASLMVE